MNTINKIFKGELLQSFADQLKNAGFRVFYHPQEIGTTWIFFTDDGVNIGTCQEEYFGGLSFSSVHKPCKQCGTGFQIGDKNNFEPTIKDAKRSFVFAPQWASHSDCKAVVKYKNIDEWLTKETILDYVEY